MCGSLVKRTAALLFNKLIGLLSILFSSGVNLNHKNKQLAAMFAGCFLLSVTLITNAYAQKTAEKTKAKQVTVAKSKGQLQRNKTFMKRKWGVEILYVRRAAAGYMIEFRYKVLDADKAKSLFLRQTKPVLTHYRTGVKLAVPAPAKTGALRNSNPPKSGTTYWMFFSNPTNMVKQGDTIGIKIGEFEATNLVVK